MHGDERRFRDKRLRLLKKGDFLIIAGDFGFLWDKTEKEDKILKSIGKRRFYTLFIEGCHDNYDLINSYPEEDFCGGSAHHISGRLFHLIRGGIFNLNGVRVFAFGGGVSADISERLKMNRYWTEETATAEDIETARENLKDHGDTFDYAVTHEAPASIKQFLNFEANLLTPVHHFFDEVKETCIYKKWYFGKLHKRKVIPPKFTALFDDYEFIPTNEKEAQKLEKIRSKRQ
jgi:DNA repair exonuclease SbcCD nuclease subunit